MNYKLAITILALHASVAPANNVVKAVAGEVSVIRRGFEQVGRSRALTVSRKAEGAAAQDLVVFDFPRRESAAAGFAPKSQLAVDNFTVEVSTKGLDTEKVSRRTDQVVQNGQVYRRSSHVETTYLNGGDFKRGQILFVNTETGRSVEITNLHSGPAYHINWSLPGDVDGVILEADAYVSHLDVKVLEPNGKIRNYRHRYVSEKQNYSSQASTAELIEGASAKSFVGKVLPRQQALTASESANFGLIEEAVQ